MAAIDDRAITAGPHGEAPLQLTTEPPRPLGLFDQVTLWGNLGISLFGPVTGAFIAAATGSLLTGLLATLVGVALGACVLGAAAVFGAATGAPAMACMRGLFGRRGSYVPTVLNIAQNIGWATMEIILIATAAVAIVGAQWRWVFVLLAGFVATLMAIRPLGSVRTLRKYLVWVVLAASAYLFVQVLRSPVGSLTEGGAAGFWIGVDMAVAAVVSFAPLAADYSRHSRTRGSAFGGAALGYGGAALAYLALGVLAVSSLGTDGDNVITALVALPAGAMALFILLVDEVDEAFANVYSTTMSVHNVVPRADRRWVALGIGVLATGLAMFIDMQGYTSFLYLIGAVFVPLFAVAITDFFLVSRDHWDLSENARARWRPVAAWAAGFVTYQLINPGTVAGWSDVWISLQELLLVSPPSWLGASIGSIVVSALAMFVLGARSANPREVATSAK
jgi:nucleobase:cation symporter-1, NCS1 family